MTPWIERRDEPADGTMMDSGDGAEQWRMREQRGCGGGKDAAAKTTARRQGHGGGEDAAARTTAQRRGHGGAARTGGGEGAAARGRGRGGGAVVRRDEKT
jgi:hypothetical protein